MHKYIKRSMHSRVLHSSNSTLVFTMKEFQYRTPDLSRHISSVFLVEPLSYHSYILYMNQLPFPTHRINFFSINIPKKLICMRNGTSSSKNSLEWVEFSPLPKSFWKTMKYIFFPFVYSLLHDQTKCAKSQVTDLHRV